MTRDEWEQKVLDKIRQYGRLSVFWITKNRFIAAAADRLHATGRIVTDNSCGYPFIMAKIVEKGRAP